MTSRRAFWGLMLVALTALLWRSDALSSGEMSGIHLILQSIPRLDSLTTKPWNTSYDLACDFGGVVCDSPGQDNSTITKLLFSGLTIPTPGPLPDVFDHFVNLTDFTAPSKLSGVFMPTLFSLKKLRTISIRAYYYDQPIPNNVGDCTSLMTLQISLTSITGTIPISIWSLPNLFSLDLSINKLSGTIPPQISQATQLVFLNLANNQLSGTIPPEMLTLSNLTNLDLARNFLSGQIPDLSNFTKLIVFNVGLNHLTGTLPLGIPLTLNQFAVTGNYIGGTIPASYMQRRVNYALSSNLLTGTMPSPNGTSIPLSWMVSENLLNLCGSNMTWTTGIQGGCATDGQDSQTCASSICTSASASCIPTQPCMTPCPLPMPSINQDWYCIHSSWTLFSSSGSVRGITTSSSTTIVGNVDASSVVLPTGGYIYFDGCPLLADVRMQLDPSDLSELAGKGRTSRLIMETSCTTVELSSASVTVTSSDSCYTVTQETGDNSDPTKLYAAFSVTSSACATPAQKKASKTWWIILVSVVGGVVLIAAAIALLAAFSPKCRDAVRPYNRASGRRTQMRTTTISTPREEHEA